MGLQLALKNTNEPSAYRNFRILLPVFSESIPAACQNDRMGIAIYSNASLL